MAGLAPSTAIQRVREDENRLNASFPTDDDIVRWLSEGEQKFFSHINYHVPRWNVEEYEFQRDSTTRQYDLPEDYGGYFLYLEDFENNTRPNELDYVRRRRFNFNTGATPDLFHVDRARIWIDPMPSVSDSKATLRLGYCRTPQHKHIGTAQAKTSAQIQLASNPATGRVRNYDSAYVNEVVRITAGTGQGQERKIVNYTASNNMASVSSKWSTNPSTDSKYQLLINVETPDEPAVIEYAKRKLQNKDNMTDAVERQDIREAYDEAVKRYKKKGYGRYQEVRNYTR